jgi:hypothetical protein
MMLTTLDQISALRRAKAPFADAVLICGKCVRKLGSEGNGMRKALKKALKHRPGGKIRVIEARCLSLCPKGRIVLASARTLQEHRLLVAQPGVEVEVAIEHLLEARRDP